MSATSKPLPIA